MTEDEEAPVELMLLGYAPVAPQGYALPCFGISPFPNVWYAATCSPGGDHLGRIDSFEMFLPDHVLPLPELLRRRLRVGAPWCDVLLWQGKPYVGTPDELWQELAGERAEMRRGAPLSVLGLSLDAEISAPKERSALAKNAAGYLRRRFGQKRAEAWRVDTFRSAAIIRLRRHTARSKTLPEAYRRVDADPYRLGIGLRIPFSLFDALEESDAQGAVERDLTELADVLGLSFTGLSPLPDLKPPNAPPRIAEEEFGDVVVWVAGRRAGEISRLMGPVDWVPDWETPTARAAPPSRVRVLEAMDEDVRPAGIAVAVLLLDDDDDGPSGGDAIGWFETFVETLDSAVVLVAPVPPRHGPSGMLAYARGRSWMAATAHAIIDTSLASSPFWSRGERRAIDRRLAELITGCSLLCRPDGPVAAHLLEDTRPVPPLIGYAIEGASRRLTSDDSVPASEASLRTDRNSTLFHANFLAHAVRGRRAAPSYGVVELDIADRDFAAFSLQILRDLARPPAVINVRRLPPQLKRTWARDAGSQSAGFVLESGLADQSPRDVCITTDAPGIDDLGAARETGFALVRYTDISTLDRILAGDFEAPRIIPDEVRIDGLRRLPQNRGLASRGVDPRDVLEVPASALAAWRRLTPGSPLQRSLRLLTEWPERAGLRAAGPALVPMAAFEQALAQKDPGAEFLAAALTKGHLPRNPVKEKRGADLRSFYTEPMDGAVRYVVVDGQLPVGLKSLAPNQIPPQSLFRIDGDLGVPCLLNSKVFAVWAHATMSRSRGWMARFSVSWTFEGLPIPAGLEVIRSSSSPPALMTDPRSRIGRAVQEFGQSLRTGALAPRSLLDSPEAGLAAPLEEAVLGAFDLSPNADDLQILERLVSFNLMQARR